jgi:hypothetical protein
MELIVAGVVIGLGIATWLLYRLAVALEGRS